MWTRQLLWWSCVISHFGELHNYTRNMWLWKIDITTTGTKWRLHMLSPLYCWTVPAYAMLSECELSVHHWVIIITSPVICFQASLQYVIAKHHGLTFTYDLNPNCSVSCMRAVKICYNDRVVRKRSIKYDTVIWQDTWILLCHFFDWC